MPLFRFMVARFKHWLALFWLFGLLAVGCVTTPQTPTADAPRLISEETLIPPTLTPLRLPTEIPTEIVVVNTPNPRQSPTATPRRRFVTVTPPDSPTPTLTETATRTLAPTLTRTMTPSRSPVPSRTFTPSATFTPFLGPATPFGGGTVCQHIWFFVPTPANCPQTDPVSSPASYQQFQSGIMINLTTAQTIYILYNSTEMPAWIFAIDTYIAGEFSQDANFFPPAGYFQPQRSFGKVWRNNAAMQIRLGWAITPEEVTYTAFFQTDAVTGTLYISGPNGEIFSLRVDQTAWQRER